MTRSHTAYLAGYGAPLYPPVVQELATVYTTNHPSGMGDALLEAAARRCPGFVRVRQTVLTADNYLWRLLLEFNVDSRLVAVAIPMATDWSRSDSTQVDRSPAVYIAGRATINNAVATIARLVEEMRA